MELTINEKKENILLGRTEVYGVLKFTGTTPSNSEVVAEMAKAFRAETGLVVMKHIYTQFSRQEAVFHAVIYKDAAAKMRMEKVTKHMKKKAEEAKKKAADENK